MKCQACGVENPEGAKFCYACGVADAPTPKVCPQCATPIREGAAFCHGCGFRVSGAPAAPAAPSDATVVPPAAAPPPLPAPTPPAAPWSPAWIFGPIPTQDAAASMSRVGAVASAILAVAALYFSQKAGGGVKTPLYIMTLCYGVSAWGLWRLMPWAGVLPMAAYLTALLFLLTRPIDVLPDGFKRWVYFVLIFAVIPVALLCGLRGSLTWRRLERAKTRIEPD
jgi:hypothetical protein